MTIPPTRCRPGGVDTNGGVGVGARARWGRGSSCPRRMLCQAPCGSAAPLRAAARFGEPPPGGHGPCRSHRPHAGLARRRLGRAAAAAGFGYPPPPLFRSGVSPLFFIALREGGGAGCGVPGAGGGDPGVGGAPVGPPRRDRRARPAATSAIEKRHDASERSLGRSSPHPSLSAGLAETAYGWPKSHYEHGPRADGQVSVSDLRLEDPLPRASTCPARHAVSGGGPRKSAQIARRAFGRHLAVPQAAPARATT